MKLTQKAVDAAVLPPGKTDHFVWDDEMPGFGLRLRVAAGGKVNRSWTVQYRHGGGTRRLLLGSGAVLGAAEARNMARRALGQVANGTDPQADRRDRRDKDAHTLRGTVTQYLETKKPDLRPRTFGALTRYLTGSFFKPLHAMPIDSITRRDVAAALNAITLKHGSITAARARATLSAFYVWALGCGLAESNPVIGTIKPQDSKPRERVLNDDELAAIWKACGNDDHGKVVRLLILCGARRAEIGGLRWSEIDLDRGVWTLPAARSKNKRAHTLPLLPMMSSIIESVPRIGFP